MNHSSDPAQQFLQGLRTKANYKGRTVGATSLDDYLLPKFCWSWKVGGPSQHSLLQLVPKSGVSST